MTKVANIANLCTTPPVKIGDFGDQSYPLRILSLIKTNLDLNTCPGLKKGDFGDQSDPLRILRCKTYFALNTCTGVKLSDFGDPSYQANNTQHAFWV